MLQSLSSHIAHRSSWLFDCNEMIMLQVLHYPSQEVEGALSSSNPMDLRSPAALTLTSEERQTDNLQTSMSANPSPLPSMAIISSNSPRSQTSVSANASSTPSSTTSASVLNTSQENDDEEDPSDPQGPKLVMAVWE